MSDWWSKDPLVQAAGKVATVVANPEQWWANDPIVADQPGMVSSAVRGAAQGLTLGAGDEGSAVAAASPIPGADQRARVLPLPDPIDLLLGGGRLLLGKTGLIGDGGGRTYDQALDQKRADNRQHQKANPISYGAGEIAGGVAPVLVAGGAAPTMFGLRGTLKARSVAGMTSGAGVGAVQGFNSGEGGIEGRGGEAIKGAAGGAVIGVAAPTLGRLAGNGYRAVADALVDRTARVPGFSNPAVRLVADALADDIAVNPALRDDLARFGPEAMLFDVADTVKGLTQGIALRPSQGRARVVDALRDRRAGTNERIGVDLDEGLGRAIVPSQVEAELAAGRRSVGDAYTDVFRNARAVDTTRLADQLDTMAIDLRGDPRRAVIRAREMLNVPGQQVLDPSPRALFNTRQALDGLIESEKDSKVLSQLGFVRQAVDDYLAAAVPGLKQVDGRFQELARQSEGLKRGPSVLDSGKKAIRPDELTDAMRAAGAPSGEFVGPSAEVVRLRQGTRADIDRRVKTKSNDFLEVRKAVMGKGDWNRDKLIELFGEERATRIVNAVDREAAFEKAYRDIVENSQTRMRGAAEKLVEVRDGSQGDSAGMTAIVGTVGGPSGLAAQGAMKGLKSAKGSLDKTADLARNDEIAQLVLTRGPEMQALFDVLARNARGRAAGEAGSAATERVVQALLMSRGYDLGSTMSPYARRVAAAALR